MTQAHGKSLKSLNKQKNQDLISIRANRIAINASKTKTFQNNRPKIKTLRRSQIPRSDN